jgi:hypothetical protein
MSVDITKLTPAQDIITVATELKNGWSAASKDRERSQRVTTALSNLQDYVSESVKLMQKAGEVIRTAVDEQQKLRDEHMHDIERVAELEEELVGVRVVVDDKSNRLARAQQLMRELLHIVNNQDVTDETKVLYIRKLLEEHK